MSVTDSGVDSMLQPALAKAGASGVFGAVEIDGDMLRCAAAEAAEEAWYRLERDGDQWFVSLVTEDRWLSESVEADLMHHGDPIEELIDEELAELGCTDGRPEVRHYRSDDMLYTFRTPLPRADVETAVTYLLAYEAAFRELGDMSASDDD